MAAGGEKEGLSLEDQDRLSRQLAVYGVKTTLRLMRAKVLVVGLGAVGSEVAKNVILAGPAEVALYDPTKASVADLGLNFYIEEEHVAGGARRDEATVARFDALSPSTTVRVLDVESLAPESCAGFDVVIVTDSKVPRSLRESMNAFCRSQSPPTGFIMADVRGVAGRVFVDFGASHRVEDVDGQQPTPLPVRLIAPSEDSEGKPTGTTDVLYTITEEEATAGDSDANPFNEGDRIMLRGVAGALGEEINALVDESTGVPRSFKVVSHRIVRREKGKQGGDYCAVIDFDLAGSKSDFFHGATSPFISKAKLPEDVTFASLAEACLKPKLHGDEALFKVFGKPVLQAVHAAFEGLDAVMETRGGVLPAGDEEGAEEVEGEVVRAAEAFVARAEEADKSCVEMNDEFYSPIEKDFDRDVVRRLARVAGAEFYGLAAFIGGIAAQEAIKHTGMFRPINNFLYVEGSTTLHREPPKASDAAAEKEEDEKKEEDEAPKVPDRFPALASPVGSRVRKGDRYDNMRLIFGSDVVDRVRNTRVFLVGAGAVGCEMIKNFAMTGVGCPGTDDSRGQVIVTDMDEVEISNLNRQFLFSMEDVGKPKSRGASRAAHAINGDLRTTVLTDAVGAPTEIPGKFDSKFWDSLDLICNALDNLQARLYTDGKCVLHRLPLLDCGTLGMSANSVTVVPPLTSSWDDGKELPDPRRDNKSCTVKEFPYKAEHCISWSKARFAEIFADAVKVAERLRDDPATFIDEKKPLTKKPKMSNPPTDASCDELERELDQILATEALLKRALGGSYETCVRAAYDLFVEFARDGILKLFNTHPPDEIDSSGVPFWGSDGRRKPTPIHKPDVSNALHRAFLAHTAALFANVTGTPVPEGYDSAELLGPLVDAAAADDKPWAPKAKKGGDDDDDDAAAAAGGSSSGAAAAAAAAGGADADSDPFERHKKLRKKLKKALERIEPFTEGEGAAALRAAKLTPQKFEKDDDANHHIDFLTACTNLRAAVYGIEPAERHYVKKTAGNILPALATTTTAVCGHVLTELVKIIQGKPLEDYSCVFMNLAANVVSATEPTDAYVYRSGKDAPLHEGRGRQPVGLCVPREPLTLWDSIPVDKGPLTISELVTSVEADFPGLKIKYLFIPRGYAPKERTLWGSFGGFAATGPRQVAEVFDEQCGVSDVPADARRILPIVVYPAQLEEDKHVAVFRIAYFTAKE